MLLVFEARETEGVTDRQLRIATEAEAGSFLSNSTNLKDIAVTHLIDIAG